MISRIFLLGVPWKFAPGLPASYWARRMFDGVCQVMTTLRERGCGGLVSFERLVVCPPLETIRHCLHEDPYPLSWDLYNKNKRVVKQPIIVLWGDWCPYLPPSNIYAMTTICWTTYQLTEVASSRRCNSCHGCGSCRGGHRRMVLTGWHSRGRRRGRTILLNQLPDPLLLGL